MTTRTSRKIDQKQKNTAQKYITDVKNYCRLIIYCIQLKTLQSFINDLIIYMSKNQTQCDAILLYISTTQVGVVNTVIL